MDADDRLTPPADLDPDLRAFLEALGDEDVASLRSIAAYVDDLVSWAEAAERAAADRETAERDSADEKSGDPPQPADVPDRATRSVMEIGGTTYDYYQWRDGDEIRSKTVER